MKQKGLSYFELLAILAITSIVAFTTIPTFSHLVAEAKQDALRLRWSSFLNSSRSQSVNLNSDITLCALVNNQCNDEFKGTWTSFLDDNKNGMLDNSETILSTISLEAGVTVKVYTSLKNRLIYRSKANSSYSGPTASVSICPDGFPNEHAFHIRLNIMGRLAYEEKRNDDGIPLRNTSSGWKQITC